MRILGKGKYSVVMAVCIAKQSNLKFVNSLGSLTKIDFDRSYLLLETADKFYLNVPGTIHECNNLKEAKEAAITHVNSIFKNMREFNKHKER